MSDCGCRIEPTDNPSQRRTLWIALVLNALMAVIGLLIGWAAHSTGVVADALDMLSDASAYAIGLAAIGRSATFKRRAAQWSGAILLILGTGIVVEAARRGLVGSEPLSGWMALAAGLSLIVNLVVLRLLRPFQQGEVHLRATWIFTRADVVANIGVIFAAGLVALTQSRFPDLIVGAAIGAYVVKEAIEILREATRAKLSSVERTHEHA
jgi:cation diffusion facilitator family transporter